MRTYRGAWLLAVTALALVALAGALATVGIVVVVVMAVFMSVCGAVFGQIWFDEPSARRRATGRFAVWWGVGGVLITGLPGLVGPWTLPVLVAVGLSSPALLGPGLRLVCARRPARRPERLSDRALARRWMRTTDEVRSSSTSPEHVLELVEERERLLDEAERRDPTGFAERIAMMAAQAPQPR